MASAVVCSGLCAARSCIPCAPNPGGAWQRVACQNTACARSLRRRGPQPHRHSVHRGARGQRGAQRARAAPWRRSQTCHISGRKDARRRARGAPRYQAGAPRDGTDRGRLRDGRPRAGVAFSARKRPMLRSSRNIAPAACGARPFRQIFNTPGATEQIAKSTEGRGGRRGRFQPRTRGSGARCGGAGELELHGGTAQNSLQSQSPRTPQLRAPPLLHAPARPLGCSLK